MPLDWHVMDVAFTQGLDTRTQKKLVPNSKWLQLNNLGLADDNTLKRRPGVTGYRVTSPANGNGLAIRGDELLSINGGTLKKVPEQTTSLVTAGGEVGFLQYTKTQVRRSTGQVDAPDCATGGGYTCYVWRDLTGASTAAAASVNGIGLTLVDEATGTKLIDATLINSNSGAGSPRVVYDQSAFFIFYIVSTHLYCRVIQTSAPTTIGTETALVTSANLADINFDACEFGTNGGVLVCFGYADGTTSVYAAVVGQLAGTPSVSSGPATIVTQAQVNILDIEGISCAATSTTAGGCFILNTKAGTGSVAAGLVGVTFDDGLAIVAGPSNIDAHTVVAGNCHVCACAVGTSYFVASDQASYATTGLVPIRGVTVAHTTLAATAGPSTITQSAYYGSATDAYGPKGPWIYGKPFNTGSNIFLPLCVMENYFSVGSAHATNNQQNTLFVLDVTSYTTSSPVVAKALYGSFGGIAGPNGAFPAVATPCSVATVTSGWALPVLEQGQLSLTAGFDTTPTGLCRLTFSLATSTSPVKTQIGQSLFVGGGQVTSYEGGGVAEVGFPLFPEGIYAAVSALPGTGNLTVGTHEVAALYEWMDSAGQRQQSALSPAVSVTVANATDIITVKIPSMRLSQKSGITIVLYMTAASGLTFYRINPVIQPLQNDTTTHSVTFVIGASGGVPATDTDIEGNEICYTQPTQSGTTLQNLPPSACNAMAVIHNRLWYDKPDQPGQFGYSQLLVNGIGLQFNPALGDSVPVDGGNIVGFSELDEKAIILCSRKLYAVYGDGPQSSGLNNQLSTPQEIPSDVGCSEVRSILRMPHGIIFKTLKGWYLLGRDLLVRYIGEGVKSYDSNNVTSAVLLMDKQECHFTSSSGTRLVYDYLHDQWSTYSVAGYTYAILDSVWWPTLSKYMHISASDGIAYDDSSTADDTVGAQTARCSVITAQTSWLRPAMLEAFARVRRFFLTATASGQPTSVLTVTVDYDDSESTSATGAYSYTIALSTPSFGGNTPVDLRGKLRRMKCKSVRFTFAEGNAANASGGIVLSGLQALALEVGLKRGVSKLPAAQTAG